MVWTESTDFYKVFGLPDTCSTHEIHKAYRKISLRVHPDKNNDRKNYWEGQFRILKRAYDTLKDSKRRERYDRRRVRVTRVHDAPKSRSSRHREKSHSRRSDRSTSYARGYTRSKSRSKPSHYKSYPKSSELEKRDSGASDSYKDIDVLRRDLVRMDSGSSDSYRASPSPKINQMEVYGEKPRPSALEKCDSASSDSYRNFEVAMPKHNPFRHSHYERYPDRKDSLEYIDGKIVVKGSDSSDSEISRKSNARQRSGSTYWRERENTHLPGYTQEVEPRQKYKVIFLGDASVGKSSLIMRYVSDEFDDNRDATVGIDYFAKAHKNDNKTTQLQLWDTAGQERFKSLIPSYIRDATVCCLCYDVNDERSFDNVDKWAEQVVDHRGRDVILALVAMKNDLPKKVSKAAALRKAWELGALFFECSAKSNVGIIALFDAIASLLPSQLTPATRGSIKLKGETKGKKLRNCC